MYIEYITFKKAGHDYQPSRARKAHAFMKNNPHGFLAESRYDGEIILWGCISKEVNLRDIQQAHADEKDTLVTNIAAYTVNIREI